MQTPIVVRVICDSLFDLCEGHTLASASVVPKLHVNDLITEVIELFNVLAVTEKVQTPEPRMRLSVKRKRNGLRRTASALSLSAL
jgi:hypothetical protein